MDRKEICEAIVLTAAEKKLLKEIYRNPHRKCERAEVEALEEVGLVEQDTEKQPNFGVPFPGGTYYVSDFYFVYKEYLRDKRRDMTLQSLWLPIVVSIITTLTVNALQWLWPLLLQWSSSCH